MELWFSEKLLQWYKQNRRDLPWRKEKDPYKIWISEIILQQTQVAQGLAYYYRFIDKFPNIQSLAKAPADDVMKLWQGLGYYSRARNIHETAKLVVKEYQGHIPADFQKIKSLKGIGDYTAAAIASFAFNLPHAVVDGNVYRLLSRLFGIKTPIDTTQAKKEFSLLANELLSIKNPALHNQAIMEFGSQFCKPQQPNCEQCPFHENCLAFNKGLVKQLPIKSKKTKVKKRFFNYLVVIDKNKHVLIEKRTEKDIWQGLYQFPLIETNKVSSLQNLIDKGEIAKVLKHSFRVIPIKKSYKHVLSHQLIFANFYVLRIQKQHTKATQKQEIKKLAFLAFPRLIEIFLNDCELEEIN